MSGERPSADEDVERLVRAYGEAEAGTVDTAQVLAAVRTRMAIAMNESSSVRMSGHSLAAWRSRVGWGVGFASAASLLMVVVWSSRTATVRADVVRLVREAEAVLAQDRVDRAYQVQLELEPGAAVRHPILAVMASSRATLWTRGDRYWIAVSRLGENWAWGRDESRRVWMTPDRKVGLSFETEEIPEALSMVQDFHSLDLDLLMKQLLTDFDIESATDVGADGAGAVRISARIKPGNQNSRISDVTLILDQDSKLVRRVSVSRVLGREAVAKVIYTFEHVDHQADERYRLEGHVDSNAVIYGSGERFRRRLQLMQFLGSLVVSET